jgi:hypothetical protein
MILVDTKKVTDRRPLKFATLADVRADAAKVVAAERAGSLHRTGNWTAAQVFNHVAAWMEYPYDGYPGNGPPWFVKIMGRFMKKAVFTKPMQAGFRLPGVPGGSFGIEDGPVDSAYERLVRASERMEKGPPSIPNPVFGPLTHAEWQRLNIGHAELHFSFLHPA